MQEISTGTGTCLNFPFNGTLYNVFVLHTGGELSGWWPILASLQTNPNACLPVSNTGTRQATIYKAKSAGIPVLCKRRLQAYNIPQLIQMGGASIEEALEIACFKKCCGPHFKKFEPDPSTRFANSDPDTIKTKSLPVLIVFVCNFFYCRMATFCKK